MAKLFANSGDPDQTPRSAASDLGLHCLPITLLGVSRLQWVNAALLQKASTEDQGQSSAEKLSLSNCLIFKAPSKCAADDIL